MRFPLYLILELLLDVTFFCPFVNQEATIQFFYLFLLLGNFIPVSLYVSMTIVKFCQSFFMKQVCFYIFGSVLGENDVSLPPLSHLGAGCFHPSLCDFFL